MNIKDLAKLSASRFYWGLSVLADSVVIAFSKRSSRSGKKRLLLIRIDAIGDFILWLDSAKDLRTIYPPEDYHITLVGNSAWSSLAENLPYFDAVWSLDRRKFFKNPFYRSALLMKIRRASFSIAIHPTFSREFRGGDAIVRASGADQRIGSQGDCSNTTLQRKSISDAWYTRLHSAAKRQLMELIRNAEFMRQLGRPDFRADIPTIADQFVLPNGFRETNYYVLFPGSGAGFRQWPLQKFADLADRIFRKTGWIAVICGGDNERSLGELLRGRMMANAENWCGKTTLSELIAIISRSKLLIGNETGAVHIAAAVSTPSVCLLGGGHYERFFPYTTEMPMSRQAPICVVQKMDCFGCNWRCIYPRSPQDPVLCIRDISVDDVWNKVSTIIEEVYMRDQTGKS